MDDYSGGLTKYCLICDAKFGSNEELDFHKLLKKHIINNFHQQRNKKVNVSEKSPAEFKQITTAELGKTSRNGREVDFRGGYGPVVGNIKSDEYKYDSNVPSFPENVRGNGAGATLIKRRATEQGSYSASKRENSQFCEFCDIPFKGIAEYEDHLKSRQHCDRLKPSGMGGTSHFIRQTHDCFTMDVRSEQKADVNFPCNVEVFTESGSWKKAFSNNFNGGNDNDIITERTFYPPAEINTWMKVETNINLRMTEVNVTNIPGKLDFRCWGTGSWSDIKALDKFSNSIRNTMKENNTVSSERTGTCSQPKTKFFCVVCAQTFSDYINFTNHLQTKNIQPSIYSNIEEMSLRDKYFCIVCEIKMDGRQSFISHIHGKKHKSKFKQYNFSCSLLTLENGEKNSVDLQTKERPANKRSLLEKSDNIYPKENTHYMPCQKKIKLGEDKTKYAAKPSNMQFTHLKNGVEIHGRIKLTNGRFKYRYACNLCNKKMCGRHDYINHINSEKHESKLALCISSGGTALPKADNKSVDLITEEYLINRRILFENDQHSPLKKNTHAMPYKRNIIDKYSFKPSDTQITLENNAVDVYGAMKQTKEGRYRYRHFCVPCYKGMFTDDDYACHIKSTMHTSNLATHRGSKKR